MEQLSSLNLEEHFLFSSISTASGGLVLLWKSDIDIQILSSNKNFIDILISYKGTSFNGTFVYGAPDILSRRAVWNSLEDIALTRDSAWFLIGDFNEFTDNSEKTGGVERPESTFVPFRSFLSACDLFDVKHTGNYLSWRGKRHTHLVHCRLDRAIANSMWSDIFPNARSHYLKFEASDYRPLIATFDSKKRKPSRLFCYDRRLRDNPEVAELVEKVWSSSPEDPVALRISNCRKAIATCSKTKYQSSKKLIDELKVALDLALSAQSHDDSTISHLNLQLLKSGRGVLESKKPVAVAHAW